MIKLVEGSQGSGKTYYMIDFMMTHKKDYYKIYTNISGFSFHDNIEPLKHSWFISVIAGAKSVYDNEDTTDQDIWNYLYEEGVIESNVKSEIRPILFVFDEAHNQFDKKDDLLVWFISYHRHFFVDGILATQDYKLIHYSYHKMFQDIIHPLSQSKTLSDALASMIPFFGHKLIKNKNKYQKHIKLPIHDGKNGTVVDTFLLETKSEYYNLYDSGDIVRSKNVLVKYIWLLLIFAVLAIVSFKFMIYYFFTPHDQPINSRIHDKMKQAATPKYYKKKSLNRDLDFSIGNSDSYIGLICSGMHCTNKRFNISLNLGHLKDLLKATDSRYLSSTRFSDNYSTVYLLVSPQFINLFKGAYNEKNKGGFTLIK